MKKTLCILLACLSTSLFAQPELHSYFRFKVPANKNYDKNISFKSKETTFVQKSNGIYESKVRYYMHSLKIYAVSNEELVDSFETKNLYLTRSLVSDEQVIDESLLGTIKTKESIQKLSNPKVTYTDKANNYKSFKVVKIMVVIDKKNGNDRVRTFTLNQENNSIDLKKMLDAAKLTTGDIVIFSNIKVLDEEGKSKILPSFIVTINTQEEIDKLLSKVKTPMIAKTYKAFHHKTNELLYLKGMVIIGNESQLQTNALDSNKNRKEIATILSNSKIQGMTGLWEIYYHTGALFAKGTILNDPEHGIYTIGQDWVIHNHQIKTE